MLDVSVEQVTKGYVVGGFPNPLLVGCCWKQRPTYHLGCLDQLNAGRQHQLFVVLRRRRPASEPNPSAIRKAEAGSGTGGIAG